MSATAVALVKYLLSSPFYPVMRPQIRAVVLAAVLVVSLAGALAPVAAQSGADPAACSFPVSETDATGTNVTVADRPERIVVLQPSAAQTVWELDAADRVVGAPVGPYTEYLEGIEDKENVVNADGFSVNREAVVALEADLVLAANVVPDDTVDSLRAADQTVFKFGFGTSLEFVAGKTELTGRLIGSCSAAADTNEEYWDRIEAVENGTDARESPRVLYYTDGFVAGSGTFIDEIVTTAGGVNVAAENGVEGYGELNEEALVEWDPEVIVVADDGPGIPDSEAFASTFAVRNDQVVTVDGNYISQPAPRIALALEEVATALETAETADSAGATDGETDDAPGFGVGVALLALASGALLAGRRR
jgi:iron complex transport system substrate-binding protein